jgi:hypothetical protein
MSAAVIDSQGCVLAELTQIRVTPTVPIGRFGDDPEASR